MESAPHRIEVPNAILLGEVKEALRGGHSVLINVKGYSMRPFLESGRDKVRLSPVSTLQVGDAVLAEIWKDTYVLHRIVAIEGDGLTLMGDGNLRGVEHCRRSDVAGVVTCYVRRGRDIEASDPRLCRRVRLWRRLLPLRRYLLCVYKIQLKLSNLLR